MCNVFEAFVSFLGQCTAVVHMFLNWQFLQEFVSCLWQINEAAVYMLNNLLCTAFKHFASVFWHYAASMYPVFEDCATKFLLCGAVAFILYLILHICYLIKHVNRLEQREQRREERQEERQNQTNAPAATVAPTCELTLIFGAEIEWMQLNTRMLIADLVEVETQFRTGQTAMEEEMLVFRQQEANLEYVRAEHEQLVKYSQSNRRRVLENNFNNNRAWLNATECAQWSTAILESMQEDRALIDALNTEARVAHDGRCHQHYLATENRKIHYDQLVLLKGERALLAHRRRLQTHADQAESLAAHIMRIAR